MEYRNIIILRNDFFLNHLQEGRTVLKIKNTGHDIEEKIFKVYTSVPKTLNFLF